jgi:ribosomal protein S25
LSDETREAFAATRSKKQTKKDEKKSRKKAAKAAVLVEKAKARAAAGGVGGMSAMVPYGAKKAVPIPWDLLTDEGK